MSNIAISMFPEEGHIIPSFKLARMLQAEGHCVTYVGLPDFESYVRAQGFAFATILGDVFPAGWRTQQVHDLATKRGLSYLKEVSQSRFYRELCRRSCATQSEIQAFLDSYQPDLFIIDGFLAPLALRVRAAGIPVVILSININLPKSDNYPPVVTNIVPDGSPASTSRAASAWAISGLVRRITNWLVGVNFHKELSRVAAACGFPPGDVLDVALMPKLRASADLPELVLCPQEFDFPRAGGPGTGVHYIEPSVDLDRKTGTFPWEKLAADKKLVFCTLGSQSHLYSKGRAFFQAAIDAVGGKAGWQLVLAVGPHVDPASFEAVPDNVVIVQWAPHTDMLKRTTIMINHAGLGTLKECIFFDVPMIVFPITRDQPGYAARVVYHGLGLMGAIGKVSSAQLAGMIDTIDQDEAFKARVTAMGATFRAIEDSCRSLDIIEALLSRSAVPA